MQIIPISFVGGKCRRRRRRCRSPSILTKPTLHHMPCKPLLQSLSRKQPLHFARRTVNTHIHTQTHNDSVIVTIKVNDARLSSPSSSQWSSSDVGEQTRRTVAYPMSLIISGPGCSNVPKKMLHTTGTQQKTCEHSTTTPCSRTQLAARTSESEIIV